MPNIIVDEHNSLYWQKKRKFRIINNKKLIILTVDFRELVITNIEILHIFIEHQIFSNKIEFGMVFKHDIIAKYLMKKCLRK